MNSLTQIPVGAYIALAIIAAAIAFKIAIVVAIWRLLTKHASPKGLHDRAHTNKKPCARNVYVGTYGKSRRSNNLER